jgi:cytochrome b561
VARYHPLLAGLHWLLALLIIGALTVGFALASTGNSDPGKVSVLRLHMMAGLSILVLMGFRFFVRMATRKPPRATTGYPELDILAPITHYGFYVLILLMAATGYWTASVAGLVPILLGSSAPLPQDFSVFPSFLAHGAIATILLSAIALHLSAALYHQFVRKDGLIKRMEVGQTSQEG